MRVRRREGLTLLAFGHEALRLREGGVEGGLASKGLVVEGVAEVGPGRAVLAAEGRAVRGGGRDDERARGGELAGEDARVAGRDDDDAIGRAARVEHGFECGGREKPGAPARCDG